MKRFVFPAALALLLLFTSCVHKTPFAEEPYFMALGETNEFVVTVNTEKKDVFGDNPNLAYIADRAQRISVALKDSSGEYKYPADFTTYDYYGAIEGNFSKLLVNTALNFIKTFEKNKAEIKFFRDKESNLEIAVPKSGIILFSSDNVMEAYEKTYLNREAKITEAQAERLNAAEIGIFVSDPKTMMELGFELPSTVFANINFMLLTVSEDKLCLEVVLKDEKTAKSFSVLIRGGYVTLLKKEGSAVNTTELKQQFLQEGQVVSIDNLKLTNEQINQINQMIDNFRKLI